MLFDARSKITKKTKNLSGDMKIMPKKLSNHKSIQRLVIFQIGSFGDANRCEGALKVLILYTTSWPSESLLHMFQNDEA